MRLLPFVVLPVLIGAQPVEARQGAYVPGWNDARVLELVARARERRLEPLADTALGSYRAHAEGTIYFYIDPEFELEPVLMRADQVALELYWEPPNRTRQVILGQRMEKRLPIRDFHYFIDRLTVVQNGFGDEIQVGEGSDVRAVVHPLAAPGAELYDFMLADSLVLRLPGAPAPIRAYEVVVRPRYPERPAFVGSVYLDGESGALVRMSFSFTRASYVDPRNDYVRITLDHGLWRGRYWLPHEQRVVVRREMPELDLRAGTVIQASLRVTDYDFDVEFPPGLFRGPAVIMAPRAEREAYVFSRGLYDDLHESGLHAGADIAAIEARARQMLRGELLRGLPGVRPAMPDASSLLRYNRAEGARVGAGMRLRRGGGLDVRGDVGWAFGARQASGSLAAALPVSPAARVELAGWGRTLRDLEPGPASPLALNTLGALLLGDDDLDPFFVSGGRLRAELRATPRLVLSAGVRGEWHEPARLVVETAPLGGSAFRPVPALDEARQWVGEAGALVRPPTRRGMSLRGQARIEGGRFTPLGGAPAGFWRVLAESSAELASPGLERALELRLAGGMGDGGDARHRFHLGGRGTVPGHAFRGWAASHYALAEVGARQEVVRGLVAARGFAAGALLGGPDAGRSTLLGVGAGVSLLHDIVRVELARGIGDGAATTLMISVGPGLRPWL
jgi:hypothetical protein